MSERRAERVPVGMLERFEAPFDRRVYAPAVRVVHVENCPSRAGASVIAST